MAEELTRDREAREASVWRAPAAMALGFGLLHGFGFAGALAEVGLPAGEIPVALLAFNTGIELGQLLFVAALLLAGALLAAAPFQWPRPLGQLPAYAIGTLAARWMFERLAPLL